MKVYLVDTENVSSAWLSIIELLNPKDKIILFFTKYSCVLSYEHVTNILKISRQIITIECERAGKNSLDFQLVSYMGYLIRKNSKNEYIIVSNDKGYLAVASFWKKQSISVNCWSVSQIDQSVSAKNTTETPKILSDDQSQNEQKNKMNTDFESINTQRKAENKQIGCISYKDKQTLSLTGLIIEQFSKFEKKYQKEKKFSDLSFISQVKVIKNVYGLLSPSLQHLTQEQIVKIAIVMCFNRELSDICSILPLWKVPIGPSIKTIKQNNSIIKKIINNFHKTKNKNNNDRKEKINFAYQILIKNGIDMVIADTVAQMITDTQSFQKIIEKIQNKYDINTANHLIMLLPELFMD